MAATSQSQVLKVLDLRHLRASELQAVLTEETVLWESQLEWDFRPSADLVRRFVSLQALSGHAMLCNDRPVGYCYFVAEEAKALIGDLFVVEEFRTIENENRLLDATLQTLMAMPLVHRIETQLMTLQSANERPLPSPEFLSVYPREFMLLDLEKALALPVGTAVEKVRIENWRPVRQEEAAQLIAESYQGHIDGQINNQYRTVPGARRFLRNVVQYPGCGTFFLPASYMASSPESDRLCGLILVSLVASDVGHITQVCVSPEAKGSGVGYELLRRSLHALAGYGCRRAGLTVTSTNLEALRLYEGMGFESIHKFGAFVWEGF